MSDENATEAPGRPPSADAGPRPIPAPSGPGDPVREAPEADAGFIVDVDAPSDPYLTGDTLGELTQDDLEEEEDE